MRSVCTLLIGLFFSHAIYGFQSDSMIIAKVNDHEVTASELLYAFQKNRNQNDELRLDSLKKYLDNYINFKLKVQAARKQGYDTLQNYIRELEGYISQIRKPYLENPEAEEKLINEIHGRKQVEINASHLLIKLAPNASPKDTLKAYKFIDSLRMNIESKEHFESLAGRFSQDGAGQNGGRLGWFSTMDMVGPFENAAYNTKTHEVSQVVRTQFGYHILFVNQKRPSKGSLKTSHIFFSSRGRSDDAAQQLAESVYDSLKNGADWNTMARKYSDDNRTKMNGGQLPWARIKQLPDDFYDIAYGIKNVNGISKPSKTSFGWHIVKLNDQRPIGDLSEERIVIEQQLKRSGRNTLNNDQLIEKLKAENNFQQDEKSLNTLLLAISNGSLNDEIKHSVLFILGKKIFRVNDLVKNLPSQKITLNSTIVRSLYSEFERKSIIAYEDSIAPIKYPDYGYLVKEYEEGLLLFEIMQQEVWNKALEDSLGARQYYENHLKQYKTEERVSVSVVTCENISLIERLKKSISEEESIEKAVQSTFTKEEQMLLKIVKRTIKASEINKFASTELKSGSWIKKPDVSEYYFLEEIIPRGYFSYDEIKGRILSDYQDHLEAQWIKELRTQSHIEIDNRALEKIIEN